MHPNVFQPGPPEDSARLPSPSGSGSRDPDRACATPAGIAPQRGAGLAIALVLSGVLAITGCAHKKSAEAKPDAAPKTPTKQTVKFDPATQESLAPLRNVDLRLTHLRANGTNVALPASTPMTLRMADGGRIGGRSAVNRYFGTVQIAVDGSGRLTWPNAALGMTRMAGSPEAMAVESQFIVALTGTSKLLVSTNGLRFEGGNGANVLDFVR